MTDKQFRIMAGLVAIIVTFTILNIMKAVDYGALSMPPIYDDVGYLLDGYRRVAFEGVHGPLSIIRSFYYSPPHAPVEALIVVVGFWLSGTHNYGPYVANIFGLAVFCVGVYLVARKITAPYVALAIAALMMFAPVTGAIITELRPDMAAGAAFALAGYWLINFRYDDQNYKRAVLLALFAVLAIAWKPSAFIISIGMLGFAGVLGAALASLRSYKLARPSALLVIGIVVALMIPLTIHWGWMTYSYVKAAIVTNADIWDTPGTAAYHWNFNFMGETGGELGLSHFAPVGLFLIVVDIVVTLVRRRAIKESLPALAYYLWCVVIYIGMSSTNFKSLYQSSFFFFPFLVAVTVALSRGVGTFDVRLSATVSAALLALAVLFMPASTTFQDSRGRPGVNEMMAQISALVADGVKSAPLCGNPVPLWGTISPYPITQEAVLLDQAQKYGNNIDKNYLYVVRTMDEARASIAKSNFILAPNQAGLKEGLGQNLPGPKLHDEMLQLLRSDSRWTEHPINASDPPTLFIRNAC